MNEANSLVGNELVYDNNNKNNEHLLNIWHLAGTALSHLIQQQLL